jgi:hypothetical protein
MVINQLVTDELLCTLYTVLCIVSSMMSKLTFHNVCMCHQQLMCMEYQMAWDVFFILVIYSFFPFFLGVGGLFFSNKK